MFGVQGEAVYVGTSCGDTHVLIYGDRALPPLILLHGMAMSSTMWYPNVHAFIASRCIYAVDIIGDFGRSRLTKKMWTRAQAASWMFEVSNALGVPVADMAGHSLGGFLAANYAVAYPERVSSLILYAPAGVFYRMNWRFYANTYPALLFRSEPWIDRAFRWFCAGHPVLTSPFRDQVIAGYRGGRPLVRIAPCVLSEQELGRCLCPVLLLIGEREVIYPAQAALRIARERVPLLESHLIRGASHVLTIEYADMINELTLRFLQQQGH